MATLRRLAVYLLVGVVLVWSLFPIWFFANMSLMFEIETVTVPLHFYPHNPTIINYLRMLGYSITAFVGNATWESYKPSPFANFMKMGMVNSAIVALGTTALTMVIAVPVGYAFGRYKFRHKNKLLITMLYSRALPPISVVVPFAILYRILNLTGTLAGLIIIYLSITVPIISWVLMGYFATLPIEAERAARVDGCSRVQSLLRVTIPMASAGVGTTAILTFLISWNEFLFSWLLTTGTPAATLPAALPGILFIANDLTGLAAMVVISIIPPLIIAMLFGRYITRLKIVDPVTTMGE